MRIFRRNNNRDQFLTNIVKVHVLNVARRSFASGQLNDISVLLRVIDVETENLVKALKNEGFISNG